MKLAHNPDSAEHPMSAARVLRHLSDHGIKVIVRDGKPSLVRPPGTSDVWLKLRYEECRHGLAAHRSEILKELQALYEPPAAPPAPDDSRTRAGIFARLANARDAAPGSSVVGFSAYDRSTARLPAGAAELPRHWTQAAVAHVGKSDKLVCNWVELPDARPPALWKAPKNWLPSLNMAPPLGWTPPKVTKKERAARWWKRWKTSPDFKAQLPD